MQKWYRHPLSSCKV